MRHAHTKTLLAYWDSRRSGRTAPAGADILPRDLSGLLAHLFILRREDRDHHVFRLAGTAICDMHKREFSEQNFLSLWQGQDRPMMTALLEGSLTAPGPATALADAVALDGRRVEVEFAFLPLRGPEGALDRALGLYQPLGGRDALGGRPAVRHVLRELRPARLPAQSVSVFRSLGAAPAAPAANDR